VHFHVVARHADQPGDKRGPRVFEYLGMPEDQRVNEEAINTLALRVRTFLESGI
jgi:hypothetical protein